MEHLSSQQNPRIRRLLQLHRSRGRVKQNRIAIFGSREILRALRCQVRADEIFVNTDLVDESTLQEVSKLIDDFDTVAVSVSRELFEKISFGDRDDGLVMTAQRPERPIEGWFEQLSLGTPLIAVAESVEKPGNLGAMLRSADGAGLDGLVVADGMTDWFHPNTIRSSLGTCFSVPGGSLETERLQERLIENGFQVLVASLQDAADFYSFDLTRRTAIVLGNEAGGVSETWYRKEFQSVCIPMLGIADSLNVSSAAAAMFYEARRQRSLGDQAVR